MISMQHAVCSMQYAIYSDQYAVINNEESGMGIPTKVAKKIKKSATDFPLSGVFPSELETELRQGELP